MSVGPGTAATAAAGSAVQRAELVISRIRQVDRPEVWISQVSDDELLAAATEIDHRVAAGDALPLAGRAFAVKDNIDVAGVPTTAGCPAYAYTPRTSAPSVSALVEAGALFVGKTNLDQFATGLVGTRSPYGAVRNAHSPSHISGGSSSGSAVAVALGIVDVALGTDTAGSGRIPAALNGIVGLKATRGLVSTRGVVPACASLDCVTVFAPTLEVAESVLAVVARFDPADPRSRTFPPTAPLGPPSRPVVAHPSLDLLHDLDAPRLEAYRQALATLVHAGCQTAVIDLEPFLDAGALLYRGGFVAERYAAVGEWLDAHRSEVDPVVGGIISDAGRLPAGRLAADIERLAGLARRTAEELAAVGADSLLLPTAPFHPTIDEVAADPVGVNSRLGRYTTFANLLDLCAVAVPVAAVDGLPFGVSLIGPAWTDLVQADLARILERAGTAATTSEGAAGGAGRTDRVRPPAVPVVVVGAHLIGQPLNSQLTDRGGRLLRTARTTPQYRLFALDTVPPKPGLARVGEGGTAIEAEVWELPPAGFATFVDEVPSPLVIGRVRLEDGSDVAGFLCEAVATEGAVDISSYGGWVAYRASRRDGFGEPLGPHSGPPLGAT